MGTRQHTGTNGDWTHRTGVAAVNAWLAFKNLRTHNFGFHGEAKVFHGIGIRPPLGADAKLFKNALPDFVNFGRSRLLLLDAEGCAQIRFRKRCNFCGKGLVLGRRLPIPCRLASLVSQFVDDLDGDLHLLVTEHHRTEHDLFRQLLRLGLDHQHGMLCTSYDKIEFRFCQLRRCGVQNILVIDVADACRADRTVERNSGKCKCGGTSDQGNDIRIDFGIY